MIANPPSNKAYLYRQLPSCQAFSAKGDPITIGLINNMPDAALLSTERQFSELLSRAAENVPVCIRFFSFPELRIEAAGQPRSRLHHEDIRELWTGRFDGLIVTGTEPRAHSLREEPCWPSLSRLVDWAEDRGVSTVWSCLAAHAAVLHRDGIDRRLLPNKLSGVFDCVRADEHIILDGAPPRWRVPHSRHNGLSEEALVAKGYRILSRSSDTGADTFIKQEKGLAIFFQGHPEYDAGALLREYRRDIGRFLAGERDNYPAIPSGYFDEAAAGKLAAFRERAESDRRIDLLSVFPAAEVEQQLVDHWRDPSVRLYANWLAYLRSAKIAKAEAGRS
jgi:homoserine O-succinyltransferase